MREGNTHDGLGACCLIRLKVENFYNQIVLCQKQEGVYWKSLSPWSKTVQPPGPPLWRWLAQSKRDDQGKS